MIQLRSATLSMYVAGVDLGPIASIYRDARGYDALARFTAPSDLPFYRRMLERYSGPVLELGCGTGRLTIPLAARTAVGGGRELTGLDSAAEMLAEARRKTPPGATVEWVEADFCDFDLGRRFGLVLFPYNAFNHLLELEQLVACVGCVRRHLEAGGRLVIDTFNPDPSFLARDAELEVLRYQHDGSEVVLREQNRYDAATQVNHITWRFEIDGVVDAQVHRLAMRIYFPRELDSLASLLGLTIDHKWGRYDEQPFGGRSPKQLLVLRLSG